MNFDYDFNSSSATLMDVRMMSHHHHLHHHPHQQSYNQNLLHRNSNVSNNDELNTSNHTFDCLINEVDNVNVDCIANESKSDEENDARFDMLNQINNNQMIHKDMNNIQIQQQQLQIQNENMIIKKQANRNTSSNSLCSHIEKNLRFSNESSLNNKFHYVLMAPTSPAVKANEDTLTYLNQGQNYELRISRINTPVYMNDQRQMEDIKPLIVDSKLSKNCVDNSQTTLNQIVCGANDSENTEKLTYHNLNDVSSNNGSLYLSIVRVCFWDRKLQEIEHDEIKEWKKEYNNVRMLEIDNTSSFGTVDIRTSDMFTNAAEVIWNGKTGASIFFRCNCTSTAFAPNKHGGEKGIHMRFQIDTYELVNTIKYQSNLLLNNYYQSSISNLSPSNSSLSSSSSSSSSSFLSNELKLAKDDFDCISSASEFNKNISQDKEQDNYRSPSPIIDYSTGNYWKHVCSSYCRIQLFRLKGAQRKLKTDKSKVERLNPPDLRKRYQPSNKVTVLNNNQFDPLYSLMPFNRYINSNNMNNNNNIDINNNNNRATTPESSIDNCITNLIDNRSLSMDYSGLNANNQYYLNNSLSNSSSHSMLTLFNNENSNATGANNYAIQPILVVQQQNTLNKLKTNDLNSNLTLQNNLNEHSNKIQTLPSTSVSSLSSLSSSSSSSASSTSSHDDPNYYIESNSSFYENNVKTNKEFVASEMSNQQQISVLVNVNNEDNTNNNYEDLTYTRLKRASSISSLNSNASYGSNNCLNYNYKNSKFQKTTSMSSVQSQQQLNKFMNSSPSYNSIPQSTSPMIGQQPTLIITANNQQIFSQQSSPSLINTKPAFIQIPNDSTKITNQSAMGTFNSASPMDNSNIPQSTANNLFRSKTLPNDCNYKFVQEWLITNRFSHLLHLFANYTSNDILRLSKDDMISLCGAPDGIRCFNMAHNIQIKPKLTIFVTFQNQTYFSAVFLADWKSKFLIKKLLSLYNSFIANLLKNDETDSISGSTTLDSNKNDNEVEQSNNKECKDSLKHLNKIEILNETTKLSDYISCSNALEHQLLHERMLNSKLEYELFLKIKDILVQTTDEVLNNLNDQSRFLVKFEMPTNTSAMPQSTTNTSTQTEQSSPSNSQTNSKFGLSNLIKILMIPLD